MRSPKPFRLRSRSGSAWGILAWFLIAAPWSLHSSEPSPALVWREHTFEDFADGRLGDGGANTYVSARGRIQLVNSWDLNQDGYLDLVFSNTHPHREKLDAAIYWGNGKDFDGSRRSFVPNDGAQNAAAADLNEDGQMDLVLANYTNGTWDGMDSFLYYGGIQELQARKDASQWGFHPFARKVTLPSRAAQHAAVEDLNKDGFPDIVFAFSAGFWEYRAASGGYESPSRIYWGSANGYSGDHRTDLPALGASSVAIADLNQDTWLDIVLANQGRDGNPDVDSYIYWGGAEGFQAGHRTGLPTHQANWLALGDVDNDGQPDIVFANGKGPVSYAYLNGSEGFKPDRRLEFATSNAKACAVADLNRDGRNDVFFTNHHTGNNRLTHSYLYWGSEQGFSAEGRQEFETVGAWGVSLADLNHDRYPEIIISNYKEHFSFDVPSVILWNSEGAFSDLRRTSLFTQGAVGNLVSDFNQDGHPDLLFMNTVSRSRGGVVPTYIYWGNREGRYTAEDRLSLPSVDPYEWAAADLNDDGWVDFLVSNFGETVRWRQESYIYWGSSESFSVDSRSALMGVGSAGASIADLDRDGHLDVILSNSPRPEDGIKGAFIYWGSAEGFVVSQRGEVPGGGTSTVADLNRDGRPDLIFGGSEGVGIYWNDGSREFSESRRTVIPDSKGMHGSEVADLNRDSYLDLILTRGGDLGSRQTTGFVYWGNPSGEYKSEGRLEFATEGLITLTVGDVNQDGWLDLVCPSYNTGSSRATMTRIYLGGPDGISSDRMFQLPSNAGTGSMVADFNRDGYADILIICHRSEGDPNRIGSFGDHVTDSYLYWGSPEGFRADNRLEVPVRGPHFDSVVDLGNIYDRRHQFTYVSSAFHYGRRRPADISWRGQTPHGSSLRFQLRTAVDEQGLENARWEGPAGPGSYFEQPTALAHLPEGHGWIQYRAFLKTPHGAVSPILEEVTLTFR